MLVKSFDYAPEVRCVKYQTCRYTNRRAVASLAEDLKFQAVLPGRCFTFVIFLDTQRAVNDTGWQIDTLLNQAEAQMQVRFKIGDSCRMADRSAMERCIGHGFSASRV
jgi:hypothetical protein